ncbi:MAG: PKD domain-containing protein [Rubricoccaceae bacterium]|nr:PKD domain-containing protein [Rubricoccaceae bacterium]
MTLLYRSALRAAFPIALLLFAAAAEAQVLRPNQTLFIGARGGVTAYGGELDSCASADADPDCEYGWLFEDLGFGVGLELGYQFSPALSFSVLGLYAQYENLDRADAVGPGINGQVNDDDDAPQVHALFRLTPVPSWAFTPFVELGGGIAFAGEHDGAPAGTDPSSVAFGPTAGFGFDWLVGRQLSLFLLAEGSWWFSDGSLDGLDPDDAGDEADFDVTTLYGGGLRYFFRPPYTEVDARIDCMTELTVGEAGAFTASYNDDASEPLTFTWDFGDGTTATGLTARHAYEAPGTYTASFTVEGPANTDTETCLVTVRAAPPALAGCRVSPSRASIDDEVTVSASVTGSEPIDVAVDFGDGATASALPASHAYDAPGTYTVTITATNQGGSDVCTVEVEVGDTFCEEVRELNAVFFDFEMSTLTDAARERLDENLILLRRCSDICVVVNGYADPQEGDQLRLSERRSQAIYDYYLDNGVDPDRLTARGLGEAALCNPKEDPGPGDRNCRRAESIPVDCDDMGM